MFVLPHQPGSFTLHHLGDSKGRSWVEHVARLIEIEIIHVRKPDELIYWVIHAYIKTGIE